MIGVFNKVLRRKEVIVLANRAFSAAFGSDELVGKHVHDLPLISKDEVGSGSLPWRAAIQSGTAVTGCLFAMQGTGDEEFTFSVSYQTHYDGGEGSLCGNAIPLGARILAIADAFDAMTLEFER